MCNACAVVQGDVRKTMVIEFLRGICGDGRFDGDIGEKVFFCGW